MKLYIGPSIKSIFSFLPWVSKKPTKTKIIKVDDWDIADIPSTLALIILPVLLKYEKESCIATIFVEDCDVPTHLRIEQNLNQEELSNILLKRSKYVLGEMIFAFSECVPNEKSFNGSPDELHHYEWRVSNGLLMFGKYYEHLWG